ncbi:hypothetical protein K450DRAFT_216574 [Umbelopsis ramanniana AG]|uniref:RING-type E3 ubiquitin transferase n=1 Tax=Umbelopsis ramanniana AG TaxID=1314678 RepID=A0AAD5EK61_UMBRA|nr:uncharacterized protein K450DRAFT_216574 [Umbelopsis ramanniana AG]KAI8584471.1 hypothetical protein K450DRAFT_216574 [Umbelopsis ramanniana AG]
MEEEEEICRVCRCEATPEQPLFHPCKCSGSIRYVHQDCLIEWLSHSKKKYCELCKYPFAFTPVYADNMPETLPADLFIRQLFRKTSGIIRITLRAIVVVFVWLIMLPYITLWVWRFYFWIGDHLALSMHNDNSTATDSFNSSHPLVTDQYANDNTTISDSEHRYTARMFFLDCFEGQIITCVVVVVFVAAFLLREWIVQNTPAEAVPGLEQEEPQPGERHFVPPENNAIFEHIAFPPQNNFLQQNERQPPNDNHNRHVMDTNRFDTLLNPIEGQNLEQDQQVELRQQLLQAEALAAMLDGAVGQPPRNGMPILPSFDAPTANADDFASDRRSLHSESTSYSANVLNHMDRQTWGHSPNGDSTGKSSIFGSAMDEQDMAEHSTSTSTKSDDDEEDYSSMNKSHDMIVDDGGESSKNIWKSKETVWPGQMDTTHSPSIGSPAPSYMHGANGSVATDDRFSNSATSSLQHHEIAQTNIPAQAPHAPRMPYLQAPPAPQQPPRPAQLHREVPERPNVEFAAGRQNLFNERNENNMAAAAQFLDNVNAIDDDEEDEGDVGDDLDGVLEAVGMRGSLWLLAQNSILMCLLISLCLGAAVWVPYLVGELFILARPLYLLQLPISALRIVIDPLVDGLLDYCIPKALEFIHSLASQYLPTLMNHPILVEVVDGFQTIKQHIQTFMDSLMAESSTVTTTSSFDELADKVPSTGHYILDSILTFIRQDIEPFFAKALVRWHYFAIGRTVMDRLVCVAIGYMILVLLGAWYLRKTGNAYGRTVGRTVQQAIRQQGIILKVAFFISIELIMFPIVCGVLLDFSTLPLFATATLSSRWGYYQSHPITTIFIHWFLGTGFMFHFAVFVTLCRDIVRPGVMWFIRDPNDPQFHPIKEILERPVLTQLRKIGASGIMYSAMIFFGIGTVVLVVSLFGGSVLPLRWSYSEPLSYFPIDLLVIHLAVPSTIGLVKPKVLLEHTFSNWWHATARLLRLTSFMFDERRAEEEGTHLRKSWAAWLKMRKAPVVSIDEADVSIQGITEDGEVEFIRDGQLVRAPCLDGVPVIPGRRMLVPVDPHTLEALDPEEHRLGHPAATAPGGNETNTVIVYLPPNFRRRVMLFLFLMWISGSTFFCCLTIMPLLLGRHIFDSYLTPNRKVHDIYSFVLGLYLMWISAVIIDWFTKKQKAWADNDWAIDWPSVKEKVVEYISVTSKVAYLVATLGLVIPLLFGLIMELYVLIPFRDLDNKPPNIDPLQDWAFGIVLLNILHGTINILPENHLQQMLARVFSAGILRANTQLVTKSIIGPLLLGSVLAITIPSLLVYSSIQVFALDDPAAQLLIFQAIYPAALIMVAFFYCCRLGVRLGRHVMQSIRDDAYLIGRRLHNVDGSVDH